MKLLHIDRRSGRGRAAARAENLGRAALELRLPGRHLVRVNVKLFGDLRYRPIRP